MIFASFAPRLELREWVRDYLVAHFRLTGDGSVQLKRYAPKPEQGITFFVRGPPRMVDPFTQRTQVAPPVAIFGQQLKRCDVHLADEFLMIRVHFQPGALFRALRVPLPEFGENYVDARWVLGPAVNDVAERMASAPGYRRMIEIAEDYLAHRLGGSPAKMGSVDRAAARLMTERAPLSVDRLSREAYLSPRQFNRSFTERIGVGPKAYARLLRFNRTCRSKLEQPQVSWPALALEGGYTDYQHMVRDFKQFTGSTPNEWLDGERSSPESGMVDSLLPASGPTLRDSPIVRPILTTQPKE